MKRLSLLLALAGTSLLFAAPGQAAPDIPGMNVQTFRAKIHVAGGVTITSTHDTTGNCTPGQAWTMTESVDVEITDKVDGTIFGNKIASRWATGNVQQKSGIRAYRETNNCPPTAKVELEKPDCDSFGGRSLSNLTPTIGNQRNMSISLTRRGGGAQDLTCIGPGVSHGKGFAITALQYPFTPISLPLKVPVKKFKKLDRGDKVIRVIRISGQCEKPRLSVGGPGITKAAADPTCKVDGLFNVIVTRLGD